MSKENSNASLSFPQVFLEKMSNLLGEEYQEFLSSLRQAAVTGLRVNSLKITSDKYLDLSPFRLSPVPWCKTGFVITNSDDKLKSGKHPHHAAGLYYLQEPSAMAAAEALSPQPGEIVLDLSAAPGGKATHLASLISNQGLLVCNEIHPKRVWDLAQNLERCGVTNSIVTNETPQRLADHFGEYFDRVMLDAPCSGEGMFRKSDTARMEWKPEFPLSCALRQLSILEQAARLVKPGGYILYSTCTFSPEENEGVIASFIRGRPDFTMHPIELSGLQPSKPEWIGLPQDHEIVLARRIWPHRSSGEGHYLALLKKTSSPHINGLEHHNRHGLHHKKSSKSIEPLTTKKLVHDFAMKYLNITFDSHRLAMFGTYIYHLPYKMPDLSGLNVIHPGWWIGSIQKDRFIPSHALAMGVHATDAKVIHSLHADDQQLTQFLRGESFSSTGDDGWILITIDGYPLGWGKRVKNTIKNFYPRGLRRMA